MSWKTDAQLALTPYSAFLPSHLLDNEEDAPLVWQHAVNGFERWPNFHWNELRSKGNGDLRLHYDTLDALQKLRNLLNRPITVNSYYRDPTYNRERGGAEASYHLTGRALDTSTYATVLGRYTLIHLASVAGFKGFGIYDTFTHMDTGPHRVWME